MNKIFIKKLLTKWLTLTLLKEGLLQNSICGFIQSTVTRRVAFYCCQDPQAVARLPQFGCCLGNLTFRSWSGWTPRLSLSTATAVSMVGNQVIFVGCILMVLDSSKPALLWMFKLMQQLALDWWKCHKNLDTIMAICRLNKLILVVHFQE